MSRCAPLVRFIAVCSMVLCFCQRGIAQSKINTDTAVINRQLQNAYKILDPDSAILAFNAILRQSTAIQYTDGAFIALITKGIKYLEKQEYEHYRQVTTEALPWAERSTQKDAVAWCYINIGESYFFQGDYIEASEHYYTALKELNKRTSEITHTTANIYIVLGLVHFRLGQYGKALAYYNQAEAVSRQAVLNYQLANALEHKGVYYLAMHQTDSAKRCFTEEMEIGLRIGKVDLQAFANCQLGKVSIAEGKYAEAVNYLEHCLALAQGRFNPIVIEAKYSLGEVLLLTGKYKEAEATLVDALQETKAHNIKDNYINCYTKLAAVYKATGQYGKALACMDSLMIWKDSLTSTEKTREFNQLEIKYKAAEKDKEIVQGQLLISQQKNKIARKNIWMAVITGSVCMVALVLITLYLNVRQKQRIQAQQIKALQQENTIGILNAMVEGGEKERARIARELHDGVGGILSAAMMRFMSIRQHDPGIVEAPAFGEAMDLLTEMGDELRKSAHNLMPEVLLKQDLEDAIRTHCEHVQESGGLQIYFRSYGSFGILAQDIKLNIYRIVQELLKNVIQHADATTVLVQLLMHDNLLTVTVEDNGKGFDTTQKKDGIGLHNLHARVHSKNGMYTLQSEPGKGTTVYIEFEL